MAFEDENSVLATLRTEFLGRSAALRAGVPVFFAALAAFRLIINDGYCACDIRFLPFPGVLLLLLDILEFSSSALQLGYVVHVVDSYIDLVFWMHIII